MNQELENTLARYNNRILQRYSDNQNKEASFILKGLQNNLNSSFSHLSKISNEDVNQIKGFEDKLSVIHKIENQSLKSSIFEGFK